MNALRNVVALTLISLLSADVGVVAQEVFKSVDPIALCANGASVYVDSGFLTCSGNGGVKEWLPPTGTTALTTSPNGAIARCGNGYLVYVGSPIQGCAGYGGVTEWFSATKTAAPAASLPPVSAETPAPASGRLPPNGAIARCGSGAYVYVSSGSSTCTGFGGVAEWYVAFELRGDARPATPAVPAPRRSKWQSVLEGLAAFGAGVAMGLSGGIPNGYLGTAKVMVFSGDNNTYLGCLSCDQFATDSLFNELGGFGSPFQANSILNDFGKYGSSYSNTSPCNAFATQPPKVVDGLGNFYGYLTMNKLKPQRVAHQGILAWLGAVCAN